MCPPVGRSSPLPDGAAAFRESCVRIENWSITITASGQPNDYLGNLRLSANGHWAFGAGSHPPHDFFITFGYLVNVASREQQQLHSIVQPRPVSGLHRWPTHRQ
jgi:hypothetical protein